MTYDQKRDVLWLLDAGRRSPSRRTRRRTTPARRSSAGAVGFARRDKYMRFERGVSIVRGGRTISADAALAYLTDDENAVKALELRGNSRITMSGRRRRRAAGDGRARHEPRLTAATARRSSARCSRAAASSRWPAPAASRGGASPAETIDVDARRPDGAVTACSAAREQVQLTMPADKDTPERVDPVGRHGRHGRAGQGPDRRDVQQGRRVPRGARRTTAARRAFRDARRSCLTETAESTTRSSRAARRSRTARRRRPRPTRGIR